MQIHDRRPNIILQSILVYPIIHPGIFLYVMCASFFKALHLCQLFHLVFPSVSSLPFYHQTTTARVSVLSSYNTCAQYDATLCVTGWTVGVNQSNECMAVPDWLIPTAAALHVKLRRARICWLECSERLLNIWISFWPSEVRTGHNGPQYWIWMSLRMNTWR